MAIISNATSEANIASLPTGNNARTVALWFKRTGTGNSAVFYYGAQPDYQLFGLFVMTNGNLAFLAGGIGDEISLNNAEIVVGTWYHLAVTYDGALVKIYINGNLTNTFSKSLNTVNTTFKLGNAEGGYDDLKIYNYALSNSEIQQLYNVNPEIIAEYNFNNTYNNVNGNTPFASNSGTSFTTDRHGNANSAININLTGTYATIANLPLGNSKRTIAFWAKANVLYNDYNMTFSYGDSSTSKAQGGSFNSSRVEYFGYLNNFYAEETHTANTWYHFVYTYDGTTAKIYRNGVLAGQADKTWNTTSSNNRFRLGIGVGGENNFNGAIDDLKIYNYDLSNTEVANLYNMENLAVTDFSKTQNAEVYPNPVKDILNIKTSGTVKSVEIFNTSGAKVKEGKSAVIDMKQLSAGIYMVKITDSEGKAITKKVIKN